MLIEQAVFTSARTERAEGYQLLGRSPGLSEADARELSVWGPSHGSLVEQPGRTASDNFFTLSSGARAVSRSLLAGTEYSGRGGQQVYTQFLVVPDEVLSRFANNPFAILRAAAASGALCVHETVPETLEALQLGGRAPVVDLGLMAQLARDPGPQALATLVQAALDCQQLAVSSHTTSEALFAGLVNLLPVECRPEFSFSTGLHYSPSRGVRLSTLPADETRCRAIARGGVTLLKLDEGAEAQATRWQGWAAWVAAILRAGKLSLLAAELEQPRSGLTSADLDALGEQLLEELSGGKRPAPARPAAGEAPVARPAGSANRKQQRADRAHSAMQAALLDDAAPRAAQLDALAGKLAEQPPEVLELLERVDDLVFDAISGDGEALAELEALWPLAACQLDAELVEQSREQYLRCALSICRDFTECGVQRPERALAAMDVLCVLFDE